jgi:putative ATP-binding cassette transporter
LATVLGCVLYLGWLAPWTLLTVMLLALPLFVGYWQLQRHTNHLLHTMLAIRDQIFNFYRDLTDGLKELKLHQQRLSDFYHMHLQPLLEQGQAPSIRYHRFHFLAQSVNQFTYFIIILGLLLSNQWLNTPLEVLGAYAIMILYLKTATMTLISALPRWSEAQTTLRQMEALGFTLSAPTPIKALTGLRPATEPVQIDLQGLTYAYSHIAEEHSFHLGPLDCSLRSGEIVFITGGNGSGKTTFLKMLIGLYTPETGHMVWNGRPVTPETLEEYRQNFAVIFAEPYLFAHLLGLSWENLDQRAQVWLYLQHQR